jgi:hypothetical protein
MRTRLDDNMLGWLCHVVVNRHGTVAFPHSFSDRGRWGWLEADVFAAMWSRDARHRPQAANDAGPWIDPRDGAP